MTYSLVLAGLTTKLFDRIKVISENKLAPGGKLIATPTKTYVPYSDAYIQSLLAATHEFARSQNARDGNSALLMYIDYNDHSTKRLLDAFFPFSLPLALKPVQMNGNRQQENAALNLFASEVEDAAVTLRSVARIVSDFTSVANLTPLLLPLKNFRSQALRTMIENLYSGLVDAKDPKEMIKSSIKKFFYTHPRTYYGSEDRHCFSDEYLYFRSPGKDRHGFFRNAPDSRHSLACLLNARSRIGGRYSSTFHYDCVAVTGVLATHYANCHDEQTAPNDAKNVNVAPNDFIR